MADWFNLEKGAAFSLDKGLTDVTIGLGWDAELVNGKKVDLDVYGILKSGSTARDMAFFKQLEVKSGAIRLSGDNLDGEGDGDDEQLYIYLSKMPAHIDSVDVWVVIHEGKARQQDFSRVKGVTCRLFKGINGNEEGGLAKFNVPRGSTNMRSMHAATLFRQGDSWDFKHVEDSFDTDQTGLLGRYAWNRD
ncbi:TerD domain-containing protein [Suillus subluteus]|nr:TerD domain-containing protein [Suillus subluteus]